LHFGSPLLFVARDGFGVTIAFEIVTLRIGVISDTHNLVRPEAMSALRRSEFILHAGDICRPDVLDELRTVAPVIAVRGNNDRGRWAKALPLTRVVELEGYRICLIHDRKELGFDPVARRIAVVVSGHSHQGGIERKDGVLYLNPGSAGPRRFSLSVTLARLTISRSGLRARLVSLAV
jgi:putative phosphoesterase